MSPFVWGPEQEKSLQDLKTAFAKFGLSLHIPMISRPFILETDASDYAISGRLSKITKSTTKSCWPSSSHSNIGGISSRRSPSSHRLCAITRTWKYFMTTKKLIVVKLVGPWNYPEYDFSLTHRPGKLNGRADSLSRREDYKAQHRVF
ncbi:hypothetical protein BASA83_010298 [Batrachochytrium salamandrivorans]|nr:hypothetical protein BASA83_010298 [Batrachochytrium salamandrivorans]